MPEAWLVALKDTRPAVGLRPPHAPPGGHDRRAGAAARRASPATPSGGWPATCWPRSSAGELGGAELSRRLEPFGLADRVAAIVVARPSNGRGSAPPTEEALASALRDEAPPGPGGLDGALTCALVPGMAEEELFALAERVAWAAAGELGGVRVGVGRAVPGAEARRTLPRGAVRARGAGARRCRARTAPAGTGSGPPRVATYKDLGSFQLLLSLQDDEALRLFCDSILGPIEASEGHYGGELMRSLEAFIEENGQWERAARRLYCHRHTLRYRIRRVEELTGRNLGSARDRIEFWLALRGRELVT